MNYSAKFIYHKWVIYTQSIPLRRWIPTNGPFGKLFCIYSSTSLLIFCDHFKKACAWRFCSSTGKLAGAPLNARTGWLDGGNLRKGIWILWYSSFQCCFTKNLSNYPKTNFFTHFIPKIALVLSLLSAIQSLCCSLAEFALRSTDDP